MLSTYHNTQQSFNTVCCVWCHAEVMIMKAWMIDFAKAVFWALVIIAIVLFSTGDYQTFIYQNF
mgnify:CR=1 FL=1